MPSERIVPLSPVVSADGPNIAEPPSLTPIDGVLDFTLTAKPARVEVAGRTLVSNVYNGLYIPPVLRLRRGDELRLKFVNEIGPSDMEIKQREVSNVHYHGMAIRPVQPADDVYMLVPPAGGIAKSEPHHHADGEHVAHGDFDESRRARRASRGRRHQTDQHLQLSLDRSGRSRHRPLLVSPAPARHLRGAGVERHVGHAGDRGSHRPPVSRATGPEAPHPHLEGRRAARRRRGRSENQDDQRRAWRRDAPRRRARSRSGRSATSAPTPISTWHSMATGSGSWSRTAMRCRGRSRSIMCTCRRRHVLASSSRWGRRASTDCAPLRSTPARQVIQTPRWCWGR